MSSGSPRGDAAAVAELTELLLPISRDIDAAWRARRGNGPTIAPVAASPRSLATKASLVHSLSLSARLFTTTYIAAKPPTERLRLKAAVMVIERAYFALKRRRDNAWLRIHEDLCNAEMAYVSSLTMLIEHYAKPMRERSVLSAEQHGVLFCNIMLIRDFHKGLAQRFAECYSPVSLANCFCDLIAFLPHYGVYINNYANALKVLTHARKEPAFKRFSQRVVLPDNTNVFPDINCFLIMPLQKLARYQLFLHRMNKELPRNSAASTQISAVLDLLRHRTAVLDIDQAPASPTSRAEEPRSGSRLLRPLHTAMLRCKSLVTSSARHTICVTAM